jgi:2-keto-4-pentenoate hydratase
MAEAEVIQSVAKELRTAEEQRAPIAPVAGRFGALTVADAYAVQLANLELRLAGGDRVVGRKIGLTSVAMQTQLGVDQPDYGHLLASMAVPNGGAVVAAELIAPRIELEVAFLLGRGLEGPGVTTADVLAATDAVFPSLEIIDSRIADWKIGLVDTVADNASSGRFVMPSRLTPVRDLDLRLLGGIMEINGVLTSWSCGAAALGDPAACVAWLANALAPYGGRLEAGEIVLSGALDKSVPIKAGDVVRAEFDRLGSAGVRFE